MRYWSNGSCLWIPLFFFLAFQKVSSDATTFKICLVKVWSCLVQVLSSLLFSLWRLRSGFVVGFLPFKADFLPFFVPDPFGLRGQFALSLLSCPSRLLCNVEFPYDSRGGVRKCHLQND